ncbi:MAG: cyclic nucleotide-binding domain-containing protein [Candidatus Methylomirabilia bacterium]
MTDEHLGAAAVALTTEIVAYLRRAGVEVAADTDAVLVRRGAPGVAFWAILEGLVEVRLTGEDGVQLPLSRMGAGSTFGEMALITGEPVSADVVALTPVRLLRYPAERFSCALGECAPLRALVLARLAANLRDTSTDVWNFSQQARALNVLMGPHRETGPVVAESGAMKAVCAAIADRAQDGSPVLVSGDPGSGKLFVAAKIYEAAARPGAPFIAVDCRTLDASEAMRFLFGSAHGLLGKDTREDGGSLRRYGALQLAHGGTLVLRQAQELPRPVQEACGRYAHARRVVGLDYPAARLVVTTDLPPATFARRVDAGLAASLDGAAVLVPRLHERRRDIVPLARLFLAERVAHGARGLGLAAEHALLSQRYAHRNAAELREAIEMAAVISDEPQIRAEHIFTGPKGEGTVQEIDLTRFALVRRLTSPQVLGTLRAVVFASFAAIIAVSLLRSGDRVGAIANAATWGLWEPALFVVFLCVGRVWCTVCPLSTAGRLAARIKSFGIAPGGRLKNFSGWFIITGFVLIIWSEHAFHMTENPRAAGFLLLALFAAAIASAVIWRRESWCRYLCPLGNLGAIYALPAVLTVRSNPSVCATMCTTHECFKGSSARPGCPVFHHPLYASEAHACKQCYECLRVCPHGSARLYLRLPLQSVWAQPDVGGALVPFALFLFFFAPAMLASQGGTWAATHAGFLTTAAGALLATVGAKALLPRLLAAGSDPEPTLSTRVAFSLLVLAWGPAMGFQLGHIGALAALHLHAQPGTVLAALVPAGGLRLLVVAQIAAVLAAGLFSAVCLLGIHHALRREGEPYSRAGWRWLVAICGVYEIGALALIVAG